MNNPSPVHTSTLDYEDTFTEILAQINSDLEKYDIAQSIIDPKMKDSKQFFISQGSIRNQIGTTERSCQNNYHECQIINDWISSFHSKDSDSDKKIMNEREQEVNNSFVLQFSSNAKLLCSLRDNLMNFLRTTIQNKQTPTVSKLTATLCNRIREYQSRRKMISRISDSWKEAKIELEQRTKENQKLLEKDAKIQQQLKDFSDTSPIGIVRLAKKSRLMTEQWNDKKIQIEKQIEQLNQEAAGYKAVEQTTLKLQKEAAAFEDQMSKLTDKFNDDERSVQEDINLSSDIQKVLLTNIQKDALNYRSSQLAKEKQITTNELRNAEIATERASVKYKKNQTQKNKILERDLKKVKDQKIDNIISKILESEEQNKQEIIELLKNQYADLEEIANRSKKWSDDYLNYQMKNLHTLGIGADDVLQAATERTNIRIKERMIEIEASQKQYDVTYGVYEDISKTVSELSATNKSLLNQLNNVKNAGDLKNGIIQKEIDKYDDFIEKAKLIIRTLNQMFERRTSQTEWNINIKSLRRPMTPPRISKDKIMSLSFWPKDTNQEIENKEVIDQEDQLNDEEIILQNQEIQKKDEEKNEEKKPFSSVVKTRELKPNSDKNPNIPKLSIKNNSEHQEETPIKNIIHSETMDKNEETLIKTNSKNERKILPKKISKIDENDMEINIDSGNRKQLLSDEEKTMESVDLENMQSHNLDESDNVLNENKNHECLQESHFETVEPSFSSNGENPRSNIVKKQDSKTKMQSMSIIKSNLSDQTSIQSNTEPINTNFDEGRNESYSSPSIQNSKFKPNQTNKKNLIISHDKALNQNNEVQLQKSQFIQSSEITEIHSDQQSSKIQYNSSYHDVLQDNNLIHDFKNTEQNEDLVFSDSSQDIEGNSFSSDKQNLEQNLHQSKKITRSNSLKNIRNQISSFNKQRIVSNSKSTALSNFLVLGQNIVPDYEDISVETTKNKLSDIKTYLSNEQNFNLDNNITKSRVKPNSDNEDFLKDEFFSSNRNIIDPKDKKQGSFISKDKSRSIKRNQRYIQPNQANLTKITSNKNVDQSPIVHKNEKSIIRKNDHQKSSEEKESLIPNQHSEPYNQKVENSQNPSSTWQKKVRICKNNEKNYIYDRLNSKRPMKIDLQKKQVESVIYDTFALKESQDEMSIMTIDQPKISSKKEEKFTSHVHNLFVEGQHIFDKLPEVNRKKEPKIPSIIFEPESSPLYHVRRSLEPRKKSFIPHRTHFNHEFNFDFDLSRNQSRKQCDHSNEVPRSTRLISITHQPKNSSIDPTKKSSHFIL